MAEEYTISHKYMVGNITVTKEELHKAEREEHVGLKRPYGLEHLHFYEGNRGRYTCCYISDPYDFDIHESLTKTELSFLLQALSVGQGKVYFEDAAQYCVGIDGLNEQYLPMKLAGLI